MAHAAAGKIPIEAVVLDYGGVIARFPSADRFAEVAALAGASPENFVGAYWSARDAYDRGTLSARDYWLEIHKQLGREASDEEGITRLIAGDQLLWSDIDARVIAWVERLRSAGIRTGLLSNMQFDILNHLRRSFPWMSGFEAAVFSCEARAMKPEPAIYREMERRLLTPPERTLFLDDSTANVEGARACGWHAEQFTSIEQAHELLAAKYALPPLLPSESHPRR